MIQYKIVSNFARDQPTLPRERVRQGEEGYQEFILKRALNATQLKVGDRIKVRRTPNKGSITKINGNVAEVNWVKNIPHFIEVKFDDGVIRMCHYSQLKRSKT
jgi:hypothetical protein